MYIFLDRPFFGRIDIIPVTRLLVKTLKIYFFCLIFFLCLTVLLRLLVTNCVGRLDPWDSIAI